MGRLLPSLQDALAHQGTAPAATSPSTATASASADPTSASPPTMPTADSGTDADAESVDGDYSDLPGLIRGNSLTMAPFVWPPRGRAARPPSPRPTSATPARRTSPTPASPTSPTAGGAGAQSGWDDWTPADPVGWGAPRPHWRYDAHPDQSGWNVSAQGHGAALLLNAAYNGEAALDFPLPPLNMRWHRPDERELSPFGNNQRGDIAPNVVHAALDDVLERHPASPLEIQLLHCWIDAVWMRHSRSHEHCVEAVRRMDYFEENEVEILVATLVEERLTDFRIVMHSVDPRARPVYGRTQDSEGRSRLFRMFPVTLERPDRATWDEDDGDLSGSSREGSSAEAEFGRTPQQRIERRRRHLERRARDAVPAIQAAETAMAEVEQRLREVQQSLPEARALVAVLLRGINAPVGSEHRVPIWRGWS